MMLTDEERQKFTLWLQENATSCDLLATQAASLPMGPMGEQIAKRLRFEAAASAFLANKLRGIEVMTIE